MIEPAEAKARLVPYEERKSLAQLYENEFLKVKFRSCNDSLKPLSRKAKILMKIQCVKKSRKI